MPSVEPFRALRASGDHSARLAPPYDVIDAAQRSRLQAASDHNVVHLTLPEGGARKKYTVAESLLRAWTEDGSLALDAHPSFTVYEQTGKRSLRGVFAAVGLAEAADGGVLPHERTYDTIVQDRYDLLEATQCNLEPVFLLAYGAPGLDDLLTAARAGAPDLEASLADAQHRAWAADDADLVDALRASLEQATLVIADGHHRWRTAQRYAQAHPGVATARSHLAFIADASAGGVEVLPIHRSLPGATVAEISAAVEGYADVAAVDAATPEALGALVAERRENARVFGLWGSGAAHVLSMRDGAPLVGSASEAWRDLDVAVLHDRILAGFGVTSFAHDPDAAVAASGADGVAILMAPPPIGAVRSIAEAGEAMPQKSTLFVPKPASGIVLRPLYP